MPFVVRFGGPFALQAAKTIRFGGNGRGSRQSEECAWDVRFLQPTQDAFLVLVRHLRETKEIAFAVCDRRAGKGVGELVGEAGANADGLVDGTPGNADQIGCFLGSGGSRVGGTGAVACVVGRGSPGAGVRGGRL